MNITPETILTIIAVGVVVAILLHYGKTIVRVLSALGGLLFLALVAAIAALALGIWTPDVSLIDILEVLR